jgi:hypothetical protein
MLLPSTKCCQMCLFVSLADSDQNPSPPSAYCTPMASANCLGNITPVEEPRFTCVHIAVSLRDMALNQTPNPFQGK